jgi:hypothetical protein
MPERTTGKRHQAGLENQYGSHQHPDLDRKWKVTECW